ncbi:hypothetical protein GCM10010156_21030 [Planobispora rosea]|uniref:Uncharacterized protein n=1 Tax=Planobispora rosea TaxID=35762 RepID=A0A8J3S3L2_PLARO|nr:DUF4287 domain-containing protein [Planobispora rosea]GGS62061.1 hypothetical protein GCM10010156_21030 [Planobispora rosea]GIH84384.1 hypothetical protein Pro02_27920 [Planobispora rosea]
MTSNKSFKSRVRARMAKTGESYTAARRHLVPDGPGVPDGADVPGVLDVPRVPGGEPIGQPEALSATALPSGGSSAPTGRSGAVRDVTLSDDVVVARTGRSNDEWFALLDDWGAAARPHGEIARWLVEEHGVQGWWAQSVTVSYERARGLRAPGQSRGGDFSISASKIINVPAERVVEAFTDDDLRARWLPDAPFEIRTSRPGKSVTANWEGRAAITVGVVAKGAEKAQLGLQHGKLPDAASAAELKAYWRERVAVLKKLLEG